MKRIITIIITLAMLAGIVVAVPTANAAEAPQLKTDSKLVMSLDGTYVFGTNGKITAADAAAQFENDVKIVSPSGTELDGDKCVPDGSTAETETGSLRILVSGDANADGEVDISDAIVLLKVVANWNGVSVGDAGDVDRDGDISVSDVIVVLKKTAGWDINLGNVKVVYDDAPLTASSEDSGIDLWFEDSNVKLWQNDTTSSGKTSYMIYAAKNEAEDCAMYIVSDNNYSEVKPSVTKFTNSYGETVDAEIYSYFYHRMRRDPFDSEGPEEMGPDALIPSTADSSNTKSGVTYGKVTAGKSQGYLIKASTNEETREGLYEATVSLLSGSSEIKRAKVYLSVWNFTLDDADACGSSFGMAPVTACTGIKVGVDDHELVSREYKKYYDYFLENRINLSVLPYDITDERCDEYLNDDRVRNFCIAGKGYGGIYDRSDEAIVSYYNKLSTNPEWNAKGYFYYVDEPLPDEFGGDKVGSINNIKVAHAFIESLYPGGRQIVPLEGHNRGITFPDDLFEIYSYCQIWCPKVWCYTEEKYRNTNEAYMFQSEDWEQRNGDYADNIKKYMESGDAEGNPIESWWYFAGGPWQPYVSFHAEDDGLSPRTSFWQQKQYDVTGVLYYCVDDYRGKVPYRDIDYVTGFGNHSYGNGILVYPGYYAGVDGPVGSIRIEYIRDGIEDYMYLKMIERELGKAEADKYISRISTDLLEYNEDPEVLLQARYEMGQALEECFSKGDKQ